MEDENLDLKQYQYLWSKTKTQVAQSNYFSADKVRQLIHSNHRTQFSQRRRTKWVQFGIVLLLLVGALLGLNFMLNVGNKNGIILLAVLAVVLLVVLSLIIYDIYLMWRIYQLRYQTLKMEPYSERLQHLTQRRWQRMQWLVDTTSQFKVHIYWGRVTGAVVGVAMIIFGSVYFVLSANSERALNTCTFYGDIPNNIQLEEVLSNNKDCDVNKYYQMAVEQLSSTGQPLSMERSSL